MDPEKPFTCSLCGGGFSRQHDLKRHQRLHEDAKPFKCPTCQREFSRIDALQRHMRQKGGTCVPIIVQSTSNRDGPSASTSLRSSMAPEEDMRLPSIAMAPEFLERRVRHLEEGLREFQWLLTDHQRLDLKVKELEIEIAYLRDALENTMS
jgi:uncharacterized Zn-finger protein